MAKKIARIRKGAPGDRARAQATARKAAEAATKAKKQEKKKKVFANREKHRKLIELTTAAVEPSKRVDVARKRILNEFRSEMRTYFPQVEVRWFELGATPELRLSWMTAVRPLDFRAKVPGLHCSAVIVHRLDKDQNVDKVTLHLCKASVMKLVKVLTWLFELAEKPTWKSILAKKE